MVRNPGGACSPAAPVFVVLYTSPEILHFCLFSLPQFTRLLKNRDEAVGWLSPPASSMRSDTDTHMQRQRVRSGSVWEYAWGSSGSPAA